MKTEVIRLRVTTGTKETIERQAQSEGLTLTALVEKALTAYFLSLTVAAIDDIAAKLD